MKHYILSCSILFFCLISNGQNFESGVSSLPKVQVLHKDFVANGACSTDNMGNIYVSEYGIFEETGGNGSRLFKISPKGEIITTYKGLSGPMGSQTDSQGNLFLNNDNNTLRGVVVKIDNKGNKSDLAIVEGWPTGMAIDKNDMIYLTNYNLPRINTVTSDGKVELLIEDERLLGCTGIDFLSNDDIIVSNFIDAKIYRINKELEITEITTIDNITVQGWGIGYITVIEDEIYATGIAVNKIFKISLDGTYEIFAGNGDGETVEGNLLNAAINYPNGIASDKENKILYISEYGQKGGIRKIQLR